MAAPIWEFCKKYSQDNKIRLHMPGHKGKKIHGMEEMDITEVKGADYLYKSQGIIGESEKQTAKIFNSAQTLYSTEGSSLCIKTMLGIVVKLRENKQRRTLIYAARNVHKSFIDGCILLDIDVKWIYPKSKRTSVCLGNITKDDLTEALNTGEKPDCVYITSPDYLGNMCNVEEISSICKNMGILLLCDNAHGAYLNFLEKNIHPITLGVDMCCDSAHKTLPCYTSGAYLHISKPTLNKFPQCADIGKNIMSMFGSTSPSYLILQSLDLCGEYLNSKFPSDLAKCCRQVSECKKFLSSLGWKLVGDEPIKITVDAAAGGISGDMLGDKLRKFNIEAEYTDFQYIVFMFSPFNSAEDFTALKNAMSIIPVKDKLENLSCEIPKGIFKIPMRQAAFSNFETVDIENSLGRISAQTICCCQPAVPAAVCGEIITAELIKIFKMYGISEINVI